MDDILKAAIQDAGLETNLCSLLDNQCDNSFSTSSPSSSSCYTSFSKDFNNNDQDFNLNDLDLSFLTDTSNDFLVSSNLVSSNSVSPIHNQDSHNNDFILSDDPFLAVLNHFDNKNFETNSKNNSEIKSNCNTHLEQKLPNRKIIKINSLKSSNQNLLSCTTALKSKSIQTNPIVRLVSTSNRNKTDSSKSDLNSLINFRNPLKTFNTPTNAPKAPVHANPVKVINLSQLQHKHLQERLISTSACKRIIKIQNSQTENRSLQLQNQTSTNSNQNIKITKVVSSKPFSFQNQSTSNMVLLNKTKNKIIQFNSNLNDIQKKPLVQEIKNKTIVTKTFNSSNITIPKVIMTPKTITTTKSQEIINAPSKFLSFPSENSHLNALNSHLSRFANSNQKEKPVEPMLNTRITENGATPASVNMLSVNIKNNNQKVQTNEMRYLKNESMYEQDEQIVVEEEEELGHAETYADYMPSKCNFFLSFFLIRHLLTAFKF